MFEHGKVKRLGDVCVHAGILRCGNVLREGIGGASDDWNGLGVTAATGANGGRSLTAVHLRHAHVHQDRVEGVRSAGGEDIDRLHAVPGTGEFDPLHAQDVAGNLHIELIVFDDEQVKPFKREVLHEVGSQIVLGGAMTGVLGRVGSLRLRLIGRQARGNSGSLNRRFITGSALPKERAVLTFVFRELFLNLLGGLFVR